jgi:hypothetical protein
MQGTSDLRLFVETKTTIRKSKDVRLANGALMSVTPAMSNSAVYLVVGAPCEYNTICRFSKEDLLSLSETLAELASMLNDSP